MNDDTDDFFLAVAEVNSLAEARAFLGDVMTQKEIEECSNRWKAAKMLYFGVPYSKISCETGMSSATIAKIKRILREGMGGLQLMLTKLEE